MKKISRNEERQILQDCLDFGNCDPLVRQYEKLIDYIIKKFAERNGINFSKDDIEDLSQEIFFELFNNNSSRLRSYDETKCKSGLAGFIQLVATHTIHNHLIKTEDPFTLSSRKKIMIADENTFEVLKIFDMESMLEARQQLLLIQNCLDKKQLNENERMIFKLHYFQSLSLEEIADLTDKNLSTVRSDKFRAIEKIKNCIEKNC